MNFRFIIIAIASVVCFIGCEKDATEHNNLQKGLTIQASTTTSTESASRTTFDGNVTKEEAIEKIKKNTRHYAKRQMTWYRNKDNTEFINVNVDNLSETVNVVFSKIIEFLKANNE